MLKVQAVTLRSKLTGYLGGRCPLQSLGRPPISGALRGREKRWPRSLSRRTSSTRCVGSMWWGWSASISGKPNRTWSRP